MYATLNLTIGRNDREVKIGINFTPDPGRPSTFFDPPEDASMDIEDIEILSVSTNSRKMIEPSPHVAARIEKIIRARHIAMIEDCCWENASDRKDYDEATLADVRNDDVDCGTAF